MTNPKGRFGIHGGQYIPETLMNAVIELEQAYNHYKNDPEFNRELTGLLNDYAGRPSRLYRRFSQRRWVRQDLSLKRAQVSTVLRPLQPPHLWVWNA